MRPLVALSLLVLLGCERPGLKPVAGELVVTPQALTFEPTFVGFPRELEVTLGNRSRASRALSVRTAGPFSTAAEVMAPGGTETTLPVRFAPEATGDFTGQLTISDEGETVVIELSGPALQPPVCVSSTCETSTFDPQLGRCAAALAANGTSCSNACLTNGMCANGRCVGTPVDCSDSNPCTLDACDPSSGCLHPPVECGAPTNPCKAARCDPSLGCVENDVRDGISCGDSDCVTAQVCIGGMCKSVAAPDGIACGTATPCQGAGTCQQNVCVQPPGGQLTEVWSYDFPDQKVNFAGVNDSAQNLYWLECAFGGLGDTLCDACTLCAATSFTSTGTLRFRTVLPLLNPDSQLRHLLAGDLLVYAGENRVGAVNATDGAPVWSIELPLNLAGVADVADRQIITAIAATPTGLTLTLWRMQGLQTRQSVLLQLNPATGAVLFAKFFDGSIDVPVVDELGAIVIKVTPPYSPNPPPAESYLLSFSPSGVERWRVYSPAAMPWLLPPPVAVFGGQLQLEDGELRSMSDGSRLVPAPSGTVAYNPLMGVSGRVLLRTPQSATRINAISLPPGLELPSWEVLVHELHGSNGLSETVATSTGGFLVAAGDSRHPTVLKGFSSTGAERFSCGVPFPAPYDPMPVALLDRRWVVLEPQYMVKPKLHVFDVGGQFPATRGWTGARGSPSGANRPLP